MNNGFYKLNSAVLNFDIKSDVNKIRFNHYIMRKENIQRLQGTLPRGQFYMTVRRAATDLQLSISTISRLVREFLDLGIIRLVSKGVKGNRSVYSYVSIEFNGSLFDDSKHMELDCVCNDEFVDNSDIELDCNSKDNSFNGDINVETEYCSNEYLFNNDVEHNYDNFYNKDTIKNKSIFNISTIKKYINESFDTNKSENSNLQQESINFNFNDTCNAIDKRTNNSIKSNQNKKAMKLSDINVLSDKDITNKKNYFNHTHGIQKGTKSVTKKKESLNKFNKKIYSKAL